MPQIEISNEVDAKTKAFRKIFDIIAETKPGANLNYGELILSIGIDSLFHDVFPADNPLLQETMVKMFQKNPHFVAEFTAHPAGRNSKKGTKGQVERKPAYPIRLRPSNGAGSHIQPHVHTEG
jgi:hypothetical protein